MANLPTDDQLAALAAETKRELTTERTDLLKVFEGQTSELDAIRKLNAPHVLGNWISETGEDDDDDFRPY